VGRLVPRCCLRCDRYKTTWRTRMLTGSSTAVSGVPLSTVLGEPETGGINAGRSGRAAHETVASYSAWHTHTGVCRILLSCRRGFWSSPACPRTFLLASMIELRASSFPSSTLSCTGSVWVCGSPFGLPQPRATAAAALYVALRGRRRRASHVPRRTVPTRGRLRAGEAHLMGAFQRFGRARPGVTSVKVK
jgi:hypothetical protein